MILKTVLFACVLMWAGFAHARDVPADQKFRTLWIIQPAEFSVEPVSTEPGGMIFKQRLLPIGSAVLTDEFSGLTADTPVPAGTELVQAVGPKGSLYCSTAYKAPSFLERALLSNGVEQLKQTCFLDADNDGKFEQAFRGIGNLRTLPSAFGILPKVPTPITALTYRKIEPSSFSQKYFVGLQYSGQAKIGTLRRFYVAFGSEHAVQTLSGNIFTKRDSDLPKALEVMGALVTIKGGDGQKVIATIERGMPIQPFGVVVTTYRY